MSKPGVGLEGVRSRPVGRRRAGGSGLWAGGAGGAGLWGRRRAGGAGLWAGGGQEEQAYGPGEAGGARRSRPIQGAPGGLESRSIEGANWSVRGTNLSI